MKKNIYKMTFFREEYLEHCQKKEMKRIARRINRQILKSNLNKELKSGIMVSEK